MISRQSELLSKLRGNHGQIDTADSARVNVLGEADYFDSGYERTGVQNFIDISNNNAVRTDQLLINMKKFTTQIAISVEELSRVTETNMLALIEQKIVAAANKTIESYIINGDTDATATNINYAGQVVPTTYHENASTVGNNGIRKIAIANGVTNGAAAYSRGVVQDMFTGVVNYVNNPNDLLFLLSNTFANKVRFDSNYSTQNVFGGNATNTRGGFVLAPEGVEAYSTQEMPAFCEADGTVISAGALDARGKFTQTSTTNIQGILMHRNAVQYAFGKSMNIVTHEYSDAILWDVTMFFGFDIANEKAGLDKTISMACPLA